MTIIEVYEKHIGSNMEMEYLPTPKTNVLAAMEEYAALKVKELSAHPPVVEGGLRWVKGSERKPVFKARSKLNARWNGNPCCIVFIDNTVELPHWCIWGYYTNSLHKKIFDADPKLTEKQPLWDEIEWLEEIHTQAPPSFLYREIKCPNCGNDWNVYPDSVCQCGAIMKISVIKPSESIPVQVTDPEITAENLLRGSRSLTQQEADILDQPMRRTAKKESSREPSTGMREDPDWEAKEIRRRIDEQRLCNSASIERAFVAGYFNRPDPPVSFIDDIADGNLKTAWERCKPVLLSAEPSTDVEDKLGTELPGTHWGKGSGAELYLDKMQPVPTGVLPEVKEIEQLRSENEGLKQELAEVYKKIDDLHQWHLSHI